MSTEENPTSEPQSQDEQQTPQPQGDGNADDSQDMSLDDYKSALASARKEAAKYRVKAKELQPLADKAREDEQAKKTELEKAQELIEQLQAEKLANQRDAIRAQLAAKFSVPAEVIVGDDEESMTSSAQKIADFVDSKLKEAGTPRLPIVKSPGRESDGQDRDAIARQVLGI